MTNDPAIYSGSVLKRFIIDRRAMGYSDDTLLADFKASYGVDLPLDELQAVCLEPSFALAVHEREGELSQLLVSSNFINQVLELKDEISGVRKDLLNAGDTKNYLKAFDATLHHLEIFLKAVDALKRRSTENITLVQQNNYFALEELSKAGVVKIVDSVALKKLLGAEAKA